MVNNVFFIGHLTFRRAVVTTDQVSRALVTVVTVVAVAGDLTHDQLPDNDCSTDGAQPAPNKAVYE